MTSADLGTAVAWLLTYCVHSTLLLAGVWLVTRRVQSLQARDLLWKAALLGGLVSSSAQVGLGWEPMAGRWEIAAVPAAAEWPAPAARPHGGAPVEDRMAPASRAWAGADLPQPAPSRPGRKAEWTLTRASVAGLVFWAWLGIAAVLLAWYLARRWLLAVRLGRREPVLDGAVLRVVDDLRRAAGMGPVRVTQAPKLSSPVAFGLTEICLPEAAMAQLDPEQRRSMLAHEVAHLARRDPTWLFLACVIERVLFLQPLNRLARRRMQEAAEYLCDDWAVRRVGSGLTLATCLVKVAEWIDTTPHPVPVSGMAEARSQFVERIHRLVANRGLTVEPRRRWLPALALTAVALLVAAAPGARAGRPDQLAMGPVRAVAQDDPAGSWPGSSMVPATSPADTQIPAPRAPGVPAERTPVVVASRAPQDTGIVAALVRALGDPEVEVRRAAAQSLGRLRNPRAVPGLVQALRDMDNEVREAAIEALGNLRDDRAVDALIAALKDANPRVRAAAVEALGELEDRRAAQPIAALVSDSSVEVRRRVMQALRQFERVRPVDAYLAALKDSDREVRAHAAEGLGDFEDRRAVRPLIEALSDPSADVRHEAAHALGHLRDAQAAAALAAAVTDPDSDVRNAAAESLGALGLSQAPPALIDALKDPNADVRSVAAEALGQIGDPRAVEPLVALLEDPVSDVRECAVEALSEIRDSAAIQALVRAMQSKDAKVRQRAAEALGEKH